MLLRLRRGLLRVLVFIAALVFLIEDALGQTLGAALGLLTRLNWVARLEARIKRLPPYGALALLAVPAALILPIKLVAVGLIASGRVMLGIVTIILAKLFATAFVGRLLILCKPALLRLSWFARLDRWWGLTRQRIYAAIEATAIWRRYHQARSVAVSVLAHLANRGSGWWLALRARLERWRAA